MQLSSPSNWNTILNKPSSLFTQSYESAPQTITPAGALTLAHGFGVIPKLVIPLLICTVAEGGYSVGDTVYYWHDKTDTSATSFGSGISTVPDANNLNIRFGSGTPLFRILNKSTGAYFVTTNTSWNLILRAWA